MYPITKAYVIPRLDMETTERWSYRKWFVVKQNPKTQTEFEQALKWSIIDANIQYDKVVYSDDINDLVKRMRDGIL